MSASNALETALLELLFKNTTAANIGDATGLVGSAVAGVFYVSLHTADPGEGGSQNTNETTYTGYARVSVARSGAGWTVSGNQVSNTATITFGADTSGTPTLTHFGIGTNSSGAGNLLFSGTLTTPLSLSVGITPIFNIGDLVITVD